MTTYQLPVPVMTIASSTERPRLPVPATPTGRLRMTVRRLRQHIASHPGPADTPSEQALRSLGDPYIRRP